MPELPWSLEPELADAIARARAAFAARSALPAYPDRRAPCPSCRRVAAHRWGGWQPRVPPRSPLPLRHCGACGSTVVLQDEKISR